MTDEQRYVVVDKAGEIVNVIIWDGETKWRPPEGCKAVPEADHKPPPAPGSKGTP